MALRLAEACGTGNLSGPPAKFVQLLANGNRDETSEKWPTPFVCNRYTFALLRYIFAKTYSNCPK